MWDHTDGFKKQYRCAYATNILLYFDLEFIIIIDIAVGSPGHIKDVFDILNIIDKWMLKIATAKQLNPELIRDEKYSSPFRFI